MTNITTKTQEYFLIIQDKLNSLPFPMTLLIEKAEIGLLGIHCTLQLAYGNTNKICLPIPMAIHTSDKEDRVICTSGGDFCFIIPKEKDAKIQYVFV